MSDFVLDRAENPHPKLLEYALLARANARAATELHGPLRDHEVDWRTAFRFYMKAMADATGCPEEELEAWLDHHEGSMTTTCRECTQPMFFDRSVSTGHWAHIATGARWCGTRAQLDDPDFPLVEGRP